MFELVSEDDEINRLSKVDMKGGALGGGWPALKRGVLIGNPYVYSRMMTATY